MNFEHEKNFLLRKASGEMYVSYFPLFCIYIFQGEETTWKIIVAFKQTTWKTVANVIPSTIMDWDIQNRSLVFGNRRNELQIVHFDVNNFFNIEKRKEEEKRSLCLSKYSNETKLFYKIME